MAAGEQRGASDYAYRGEQDKRRLEILLQEETAAGAANEGEHLPHIVQRVGYSVGTEEDPRDDHHEQCVQVLCGLEDFAQNTVEANALYHHEGTVQKAPYHEGPAGPMPEASEEEHDVEIEKSAFLTLAVSS